MLSMYSSNTELLIYENKCCFETISKTWFPRKRWENESYLNIDTVLVYNLALQTLFYFYSFSQVNISETTVKEMLCTIQVWQEQELVVSGCILKMKI